jgi:D-glycero-alpha-D-manno-heptose 1-phosphate guanylyltransferase
MNTREAIILAGGFGTRLQHIVNNLPKPMANINGKPFLFFLLRRLQAAGISHIILSTGYLHEKIENYFGNSFENLKITYSHETDPLGTGGAIQFALGKAETDNIFVLNGDTLFDIDFEYFDNFYRMKKTVLAVALRKEKDTSRYGSVKINETAKIIGFTEKHTARSEGLINGGIYLLNKKLIEYQKLPIFFSFEKEILEKRYTSNDFFGLPFDSYFIDIGIPEDYQRAQIEIK